MSETLLIPLAARALETGRADALFHDEVAVALARRLAVDWHAIARDRTNMAGIIARTVIIDSAVRDFTTARPKGWVLNLGAGLCTRFLRLDNGAIHWIDVDLPPVVELKRALLDESDRYRLLAASVTDSPWLETIPNVPGTDVLVVAEGLLMYLPEEDVRSLISRLADRFPGGAMVIEAWATLVTRVWARWSPSIRRTGARLQWGLDHPEELSTWGAGVRVEACWNPGDVAVSRWGWLRLAPWLRRRLMAIVRLRFEPREACEVRS